MSELKLFGMTTANDDVMAAGKKRQHEPPQIVGDLLKVEIAEEQERPTKYQMTIAKLPLAKDPDDYASTRGSLQIENGVNISAHGGSRVLDATNRRARLGVAPASNCWSTCRPISPPSLDRHLQGSTMWLQR